MLTLEQKKEKVKDFRPIDDAFFEILADDTSFCEEILRIILSDHQLTVQDVIVQSSKRNIYGRSVRLDALCTLGDGSICNIEVQRADNDNHLKRVRFNASSITVTDSQKWQNFDSVTSLYIEYISEFDIFKKGYTTYHIDSVIRETSDIVDDGLIRIFVNTEINDGSNISELMSCFTKKKVNNTKFPIFSNRMNFLKNAEGGVNAVCEVMERYEKIAAKKAVEKANIKAIITMIEFNIPKENILTKYSKDEYNRALKEIDLKAGKNINKDTNNDISKNI